MEGQGTGKTVQNMVNWRQIPKILNFLSIVETI